MLVLLSGQGPAKEEASATQHIMFWADRQLDPGVAAAHPPFPAALDFGGEKDALSFTVRGWDGLQLQEVQQDLDLRRMSRHYRDIECTTGKGGANVTCAMTSRDQLSPMLMACVGLAGILLSFSDGLSSVGPNTVARLWRDILLMLSFSATLRTTHSIFETVQFFSYNPE